MAPPSVSSHQNYIAIPGLFEISLPERKGQRVDFNRDHDATVADDFPRQGRAVPRAEPDFEKAVAFPQPERFVEERVAVRTGNSSPFSREWKRDFLVSVVAVEARDEVARTLSIAALMRSERRRLRLISRRTLSLRSSRKSFTLFSGYLSGGLTPALCRFHTRSPAGGPSR